MRSPSGVRRPTRRLLTVLLLVVITLMSLSGCARVRAALAVQPDDTVRGEVVVATPETGPEDTGPEIVVPDDLEGAVEVEPYRQEGYTGSLVRFSGLTFEQVGRLSAAAGPAGENVRFEMRRVGNRVLATGTVDLTTATVDLADFQLRINVPGQVIDANGDEAESGGIGWSFTPGQVGDINAVIAYDDPNAPDPVNWSLALAAVVAAAVAGVVLVARRTRNPPL